MPLGYHVIFSTYGFWLPNDPRGSWSTFVGSWELFRFGSATKVQTRRSVADRPHDQALRQQAKAALKYSPVVLTGPQALVVGLGFKAVVETTGYVFHACAILPDHVHLVTAAHPRSIAQMVSELKASASRQLIKASLHPFLGRPQPNGKLPTVWGRNYWKVFLRSDTDLLRAIDYVESNPPREGKPRQTWSFVTPYQA